MAMSCLLQASKPLTLPALATGPCDHVESGRNRLQPAITANITSGHLFSTLNGETGILAILHSILSEGLSAFMMSFFHSDKSFILLKNNHLYQFSRSCFCAVPPHPSVIKS
jgi:hypothetical protein